MIWQMALFGSKVAVGMTFTPDVYEIIRNGCIQSARQVVPVLYETFTPSRVLDIGGGEGWWAREFAERGCRCLVMDESVAQPYSVGGVDGGVTYFNTVDLAAGDVAGFLALDGEKFDMALCLEVGEHLPDTAADALVATLTLASDVVVWSAAIPGQGGHGHVNEQWTAYWYAKFQARGFDCFDFLRMRFWDDEKVEPWYRQNLLVYANKGVIDEELLGCPGGPPLDLVHPIFFQNRPVAVDWICASCGTGWMEKTTVDGTTGCPNCGVKPC